MGSDDDDWCPKLWLFQRDSYTGNRPFLQNKPTKKKKKVKIFSKAGQESLLWQNSVQPNWQHLFESEGTEHTNKNIILEWAHYTKCFYRRGPSDLKFP